MRSTMYNNPYLAQLNNVNKQLASLAINQKAPINIVNQKKTPSTDNSIMIMTSYNSNNNGHKPQMNTTMT